MKFELFVAKRYLLKGQKYAFVSTISIVSTIGVAIGAAALIIALSLLNGAHGDILGKMLSSIPPVMIKDAGDNEFGDYRELLEEIKSRKINGITSVEPVVVGTVLLKGMFRNSSGALLKGIDLETPRPETWLKDLYRGRLPLEPGQLAVGSKIAHNAGVLEGETCTVIAPRPYFTGTAPRPEIRKFNVTGMFESRLYEIDNQLVITNLKAAQDVFELGDKISFIQVSLRDIFDAEEVAVKLREIVPPGFSVVTWKETKASLYSALKMEKNVFFLVLTLIIVVASLNIIAGLMLLVIQKIKDIAILLSYGATPPVIRRIFFLQGGIIGILGTGSGVILGLLFCYFADKFKLLKLSVEIYQMSHVPFSVHWFDVFIVVAVSLIITFTATLIPARRASSVNVVEAIKNE